MAKTPREECPSCGNLTNPKNMAKFSWRYTDNVKMYAKSKRRWIHTGGTRICLPCIKDIINNLNIPF